jgi:DNA mismatch repair protein MutS2
MKKIAVYLPVDLYHELAQRATREGASVEELVRFAVVQTYKSMAAEPAAVPPSLPAGQDRPRRAAPKSKPKPRPLKLGRPALRPATPPLSAAPREPISNELHIRRLPVDEALYRLDAYLDAAFLADHLLVRVIHGKGAGILKGAVWQRLKEHPLVRSYRLADPGDGDAGVTVVELARR